MSHGQPSGWRSRTTISSRSARSNLVEGDALRPPAAYVQDFFLVAETVHKGEFDVPRDLPVRHVIDHQGSGEPRFRKFIGGHRLIGTAGKARGVHRRAHLGHPFDYGEFHPPLFRKFLYGIVLSRRAVHAVRRPVAEPCHRRREIFVQSAIAAALFVNFIQADVRHAQRLHAFIRLRPRRPHDDPLCFENRPSAPLGQIPFFYAQTDYRDHHFSFLLAVFW